MNATGDPRELAERITRSMVRDGAPPNGVTPEQCGPWRDGIQALYSAYWEQGTPGAKRAYDLLCKGDHAWIGLLAADQAVTSPAPVTRGCPPLPESATAIYAAAEPCGAWLDDYIDFAERAVPMAPRSFHEAAGLFLISLAIARRLFVESGIHVIYPNLFLLYVAESGIYTKSAGLKLIDLLISKTGMTSLLLPDSVTPESLVEEMSIGEVPKNLTPQQEETFLLEKRFAAQRGWLLEESSALFTSMARDYNAELKTMFMRFFDCDRYSKRTRSRGKESVEESYVSFFGVSNPPLMHPHFANAELWGNGLWSRFIPLQPRGDEPPHWEDTEEELEIPTNLVKGLRKIFELFPIPKTQIQEDKAKERFYVKRDGLIARKVTLAPGVREAWHAYRKAVGFDMQLPEVGADLDPKLKANYTRYATQAIKVAMCLAVADAALEGHEEVVVTTAHYARAQQIVEGWRATLHQLWDMQSITEENKLHQRILDYLRKSKPLGMTRVELCEKLRSKSRDTAEALEALAKAGRVATKQEPRRNGVTVELWYLTY